MPFLEPRLSGEDFGGCFDWFFLKERCARTQFGVIFKAQKFLVF